MLPVVVDAPSLPYWYWVFEEGPGADPAPPAPTTILYEPGLGFTGLDELY